MSGFKFVHSFGGGDTLGYAGGAFSTVILNLFQHLVNGRFEDKKAGRYADIGGQSPCKDEFSSGSSTLPKRTNSLKKKAAFALSEDATRAALPNSQRRVAFTLAEVLITLGIIGVVAAITIPTLVSKYQMKVFETAFKKQYSVIQNAINYSVLENGISECYTYFPEGEGGYFYSYSDCTLLKNSLISLLQLQPYDMYHDNEYKLKSKDEVLAEGGKTLNPACNILTAGESYFTKDGTIFLFAKPSQSDANIIVIDVNGKKGPNKWGYDIFYMTLTKRNRNGSIEQKLFLTDEYCSLVEKGGRLPRTILQNKEITEDDDFSWTWK